MPIIRFLQLIWSMTLNVLMGGVLYGYASLVYVLMSSEDEGGCSLGSKYAQLCFTIAISFSCISPIFMSALLEGKGPRFTAILCTFLFSIGALIFGVSDIHRLGLFIPGLSLMAFAGPGINGTSHYCVHLFPQHKSLVSTLLDCSYHMSFIVLYVAQALWTHKLDTTGDGDFRSIFCYYSFICLGSVLPTLFLMPDSMDSNLIKLKVGSGFIALSSTNTSFASESLDKQDPVPIYGALSTDKEDAIEMASNFGAGTNAVLHDDSVAAIAGDGDAGMPTNYEVELTYDKYHYLTLWDKLRAPTFQRLVVFFSLATLWVNFYIGTVDMSLGDGAFLPWQSQHQYALLFSLMLAGGVLAIPVVSACLHRKNGGLMNIPITALVLSCLSLMWACGILVETPASVLPSFVCYSLFRVFLYSFTFAYVHDVFDSTYNDVMIGVLFLCSGLVNLLAIPLARFAMGDCAVAAQNMLSTCDRGKWSSIFLLKILSTGYFLYFTLCEWKERRHFLFSKGYPVESKWQGQEKIVR